MVLQCLARNHWYTYLTGKDITITKLSTNVRSCLIEHTRTSNTSVKLHDALDFSGILCSFSSPGF